MRRLNRRSGPLARSAALLLRLVRRVVITATLAVITVAVVAALLLAGRADVVLGESITDASDELLPPNPDLVGATSVLHLSDDEIRSVEIPPKTVALTFDDGPDPVWTPAIQRTLDRHGVPGTFFVVGENVLRHPGVVRDLDAAGHEIGNHTFTHARLGTLADWQITSQVSLTQQAVVGAIGKVPTSFRPPYSGNPEYLPAAELSAARLAAARGTVVVLTDRVVADYDLDLSVEQIVSEAMPQDGEGAILTFHDAGGDRQRTVEAVDALLTRLEADGYQFVRASDLTGAPPVTATMRDSFAAGVLLHGTNAITTLATVVFVFGVVYAVLGAVRCVLLPVLAHRNRTRHARRVAVESVIYRSPVTVIVPAYNEAVGIEAAVRSLCASEYSELEVIVVDDGSTDATAAIAEGLGLPNVRVIRQANGGKPSALNTGLRHATHDIVVMVDGDTIFDMMTISRLVQPFVDPEVGAVAGNPRVGNRKGYLASLQQLEYCIGSSLERRMFDEVGAMLCIPGAIGAFRRRAVLSAGGISADTLAEDTDLTMAITRSGWRVAYAPDAHAYTEVPTTVRGLYSQRFRWAYGILQAIVKHRQASMERGRAGTLGRFVFPYTLVFGYVAALVAPAIDWLMIYALTTGAMGREVLVLAAVANGLSLATAMYALRIDRAPLRHALLLPLQIVVYRQVLYLVTVRSIWTALLGVRLRWNSVARQGGLRIHDADTTTAIVDLTIIDTIIDVRDERPENTIATEAPR